LKAILSEAQLLAVQNALEREILKNDALHAKKSPPHAPPFHSASAEVAQLTIAADGGEVGSTAASRQHDAQLQQEQDEGPQLLTMAYIQKALQSVRPSVQAELYSPQQLGNNKRATLA
jgi:hypothetical protein